MWYRDPLDLAVAIRNAALPLFGTASDDDPLLELIGDAHFVLIGEASHGTHEFYRRRALITQRLIAERGFQAVAVEADWPDADRINRFVRGMGDDVRPIDALADFRRFPTWMWRNTEVLAFVEWLRKYNDAHADRQHKVGFYGIDLYSLNASIEAVLRYLEQVNPQAAQQARLRYACFEQFGPDPQLYGYATEFQAAEACTDQVVEQLLEFQRNTTALMQQDGRSAEDAFFSAEQNARLVQNAEAYYRAMYQGRNAWNVRDTHMADTLDELAEHLRKQGQPPKIVVWAHNSHLGDARATEMRQRGEVNVGQLMRERHGAAVVNIGFSTYRGTVTAASDWGGRAEQKQVRPGLPGSYEALLHAAAARSHTPPPGLLFLLRDNRLAAQVLPRTLLERAIGVIYRPETERLSHYFNASIARQFDALIHIDETQAVKQV